MGAMLEEIAHLYSEMEEKQEIKKGGKTYGCGTLFGFDTVLVFSGWGKVAAASTATTLIEAFGVEFLIFTGVAGAVHEDLNIGDIVIGKSLYQHDMDARPIFKRFQVPLWPQILFQTNPHYCEVAKCASLKFLERFDQVIKKSTQEKFRVYAPKIHIGVIATGDLFVKHPHLHSSLKLDFDKVLAVEMEGAAVAQVCEQNPIPYLVIRTISDRANQKAAFDFQAFVVEVASFYSKGIISVLDKK